MKNFKPVMCLAVFGACLSPQLARPARAGETSTVEDSAAYKNARSRLITLDFSGEANVVDVLPMVAREAEVRLILGENVTGTLPKFALHDVTGKQAVEAIARMAKLPFLALDERTFVVGNADQNAIAAAKNAIVAEQARVQAELSKPHVNISRTVRLSLDIRNTNAQAVLQQIADEGGLRLIFVDSPDFTITRLQIADVTPEAAIQWVANMAKFNAIPMTSEESGKDVRGFLIRSNRAYIPAPSISILPSPRDKVQEMDPMLVTPPRNRTYSGLLPKPEKVPMPGTQGLQEPEYDFLQNGVPPESIPQNVVPQK